MHVTEFIEEMERIAPPELAEEFDAGRIGLIVEGKKTVSRVCCALDVTPSVVKRAVAAKADMLVVHHTPIWTPLLSLTGPAAALMRDVLASGMNIWVMHTNFDHAESGVNDALAELLALEHTVPLELGMVGDCPLTMMEISRRLGCPLRVWGKVTKSGPVGRLAIAGGSGFDLPLMEEANGKGALAFLSSELKHSVCRAAPLPCIEATHYALEAPAMKRLAVRKGWKFIADPPVLNTVP